MIWYEMKTYSTEFNPVEVEKASEEFVTIKGRRLGRRTEDGGFYPTKEEAKQALIDCRAAEVARQKEKLEYYEQKLEEALNA